MSLLPEHDLRTPIPAAPPLRSDFLTVTAVTALIKDALAERLPPTVHVLGQISNFKRHASGHLYLTLKDDGSELACVIWRSAAVQLPFAPKDGMEVIATGYIDVFERAGRYQLYCRRLEPRGVGALELAFRQLTERLRKEGLFDAQHKKPIPRFPRRIAVVTSPTGAAIHDILRTLQRRYPPADVLLVPVPVQGPGAGRPIAAAISAVNRRAASLGGVDVMIVGRGGGSLEDLWAFNEEVLARAVFASVIPIISAVGHESDISVCDLVADVRAATPTAAAELAVPDVADLLPLIDRLCGVLRRNAVHATRLAAGGLGSVLRRRALAEPDWLIRRREQAIDLLCQRMTRPLTLRGAEAQTRLRKAETSLARIEPQRYLALLHRRLAERAERLTGALGARLRVGTRAGQQAERRWLLLDPAHKLPLVAQRVTAAEQRLLRGLRVRLDAADRAAAGASARLSALDPRGILRRGYTITRTKANRRIVRDPSALREGARIITETSAGEFESRVIDTRQPELFE